MTPLEDSLRDYYTTKADDLSLPPRVFNGEPRDDGSVTYISMGPDPHRRTPILLAAAASIALLAGAAVVVSRSGDKSRGPLVVSNASTVASSSNFPLFAATWLPDGYALTGGSDGSDNVYPAHTLIYRDRSQPLGSPAILITVDTPQTSFPGSEITIQGRAALDVSNEKNAGIVMTDPLGVGLALSGRSIDMNQLRQVAETVKARSSSPADGIEVGGLPQGFEKVGDYVGTASSRMVDLVYSKPGSSDEQLTVEVSNVDMAFEELVGVMADSPPTPVTVRGHDGFQLHVTTPLKQTSVAWKENPQIVAAVFSPDLAPEVLLKVAEGLKTISPDELKKILSMPGLTGRAAGTNVNGYTPSVTTPFTCADTDSTAPQGTRAAPCSDLYAPPLWPGWLPNGFALSQVERTPDTPLDWKLLRYTTSVPGIDAVNDMSVFIQALSPTTLKERLFSLISTPPNAGVLPTTIRGHEAFILSDPTGQNHSVGIAWMETPTQYVELESSRVSVRELRQMAESLANLPNDEWKAKLARNDALVNGVPVEPSAVAPDGVPTSTTTP